MTVEGSGTAARLTADCFLRARPGTSGRPLGLGKRGAALACADLPPKGGWVAVIFRGALAWVSGRFVRLEATDQGAK